VKGETTALAASVAPRGLSPLAALVRQHDRDRYLTALFAPAAHREALFALYAFNYEIARVREIVTTPMLGQIRLQWWREVVEGAYAGAPPRVHEVAAPLTAVIWQYGLSRAHLDRMIDMRELDLADEPPASLAELEAYSDATASGLIHLALEILSDDQRADRGLPARNAAGTAALHVGIAYALAGLLRAMPVHARAGRCYIPADLAADAGLDPLDYAEMRPVPALWQAVEAIGEAAAGHLRAARQHRFELPRGTLPALLPAVIAERALARLQRAGWNPFDPNVAMPDPLLMWRLLLARLSHRF
jgi:NADH dehydrogenase [ubiquinone] 1 alpha subcomplex assembly factor 6